MKFEINYGIEKVWFRDFGAMAEEILDKLKGGPVPLRLVFFGNPDNNQQYLEHLECLRTLVAKRYGADRMPLVTYVAQKPLDCGLTLEWHCVSPEQAGILVRRECGGIRYITADTPDGKWLFTEGILPSSLEIPMLQQSNEVLDALGNILTQEKMDINSVVRQWNYIERITAVTGDRQHYQDFNDARSHFYARTKWPAGYPAATGIGTTWGGIMVEADALAPLAGYCRAVALDNQLQVAAHDYSQNVLIGMADKIFRQKTTPKFERAKTIASDDDRKNQVYISGTAAIRGEESLTGVGIEKQTVITLENIEFLVSAANLKKYGVKTPKEPRIKIFRVYLKSEELLPAAREIVENRYPDIPAMYVLTDVCRDELLIEIEGVAQTW